MFKSRARKEAEHRLKVEREMERIRQRKEATQQQGEAIRNWFSGLPPENRNLILTGIAGLFTGGLAGAIVSPIAFHQYNKRINNSAMKWLAWAGTGLIAAPILVGAQTAIFGGELESPPISAKSKVNKGEVQLDTESKNTSSSPTTEATPVPESRETSIGATVTKTGLDFSYEASGRVVERENAIVVTYYQSEPCDNGRQFKQTWETTFNLQTQRWGERVQPLSDCLANGDGQWIEFSEDEGDFSISTEGNQTVIKANALETDGSLIVPNALVVEYEQ